jgi:hypothetical protein
MPSTCDEQSEQQSVVVNMESGGWQGEIESQLHITKFGRHVKRIQHLPQT